MFLLFDPGLDRIEQISGIDLSAAFRLERGPFSNTRNYSQGDVVETGVGDDVIFWIASVDISQGGGEPTYASSGLWWKLAGHGFWREELDMGLTYSFHDGDSYHIGDEVFIVTADVTGITGEALRMGDHILEISNFPISDEGVLVSDNTESLNFTGAAITCTGDRDVICDVTGGSGGTTVTANPSGTDGDDLTRIDIDGVNYNVAGSGTDAEIEHVLWATYSITSTTGGSWSLSSTGTALGFTGGGENLGTNTEAGALRLPLIQPDGYLPSIYIDALTTADVVTSSSQVQWLEKARHFQFTGRSMIGTSDVRYGFQAGNNNAFQADFWRLGFADVVNGTVGDSIRVYGRRLTGGGGMGGGGGGIRIEESDTVRIASADALDFNSADFQINTVQDPEAGVAIAAALTRDTEVADAFDGVTVSGRDFTFDQIGGGTVTATVPLIDIDDYPTRVSTIGVQDSFLVADFDGSNAVRHTTGFDLRVFVQDGLTTDGVVDSVTYAGGNLVLGRTVGDDLIATGLTRPFDLHDDVTTENATPNPLDRLVSSDESAAGDPNEWLTIRDLLFEMADAASTRQATPADDDRFFLADVSESGRPLRFIETDELRTTLVTETAVEDVLFTAVHAVPDITSGVITFHSTGFTGWSGKTLITFSLGYHINTGANGRELATVTFFVADLLAVPQTATDGATVVDAPGTSQNAITFAYHDRAVDGQAEDMDGVLGGLLRVSFARTGAGELLVANSSNNSAFLSAKAVAY